MSMVADLCHVVLSPFRGEKAKRRHAKTRQMVTFSCLSMATFRPATRKNDTFHASPFRLLFVVSLPVGAKGRHAKTRQNHPLAGFRVAIFRVFAPKTRLYDSERLPLLVGLKSCALLLGPVPYTCSSHIVLVLRDHGVYMYVVYIWKWSSAHALGGVSGVASFITTDEQLQKSRGCCFLLHSVVLRQDLCNGFTYLQRGRYFINLFLFKYMPF